MLKQNRTIIPLKFGRKDMPFFTFYSLSFPTYIACIYYVWCEHHIYGGLSVCKRVQTTARPRYKRLINCWRLIPQLADTGDFHTALTPRLPSGVWNFYTCTPLSDLDSLLQMGPVFITCNTL